MAIDGVFIHFLVEELNQQLKKARLESISFERNCFGLSFYKEKQKPHLLINFSNHLNCLYLTSQPYYKSNPTPFLTSLKTHLEGAILERIYQVKSDRVIVLEFSYYDYLDGKVTKELYFEAMQRHANLYLLKDGLIIDCFKKRFNVEGRKSVPNATFEPFISDKQDLADYQYDASLSPKDLVERYLGVSLKLASYLCEVKTHPYHLLVSPQYDPERNDAYCFNGFTNNQSIATPSLSQALDLIKAPNQKSHSYYAVIESLLTKRMKKKENFQTQLNQARIDLDYQQMGEMIYQSNLDLNEKLESLNQVKLDPLKTLNQNAQHFFKLYHKAKRSIEKITSLLVEVDSEIVVLSDLLSSLDYHTKADETDLLKTLQSLGYQSKKLPKVLPSNKKSKAKIRLLEISYLNTRFLVGKNMIQNGYLTFEVAKKSDYFFHVANDSGAHVVCQSAHLDEPLIRFGAKLAAYFSKQRHSSSIGVNYTQIKHVAKIKGLPASRVKLNFEKTIFIDLDDEFLELIKNYQ